MERLKKLSIRDLFPTWDDMRQSFKPMARGAPIGTFLGVLPGAGATISAFVAYGVENRVAKTFASAKELSKESRHQSLQITLQRRGHLFTLSLGIPGDAVMALMLGALLIHGAAGRSLSLMPEIFGALASFWIGNLMLMIMNIPMISIWVRILTIPYRYLYPCILMLVCVGVYSVNNSAFDLMIVFAFTIIGFGMAICKLSPHQCFLA